ncbi:retrovirus-related pol polyprotein from transposon TNT 1-94 [Tanacetum coccineum]
MKKLENENVSLEFQVQSLIKERENVKTEYQKLFYSIKRTRTQTQGEINELIENVNQNTYAYVDVRAQKQDLLITISELKAKLKNVEKSKSVNTKFGKDAVSHNFLCDTPLNKQDFQKKIIASKTKEKHVLSKTITLQTSPNKQQAVETNNNVIAPGMYKVKKTQNTNTNKAKSVLSSIGLRAISSVRIPSNRDSSFKNNVLSNTKNSSEKVEVFDRSNKKSYVASKNVDSNKNIVTNDDIKNAVIAKTVLYVSCAKNMFIPCHDNCLAKYKLNVNSKLRRALFTTSRTVKSKFEDPTPVVSKTRLSHLNFGTIHDLTKHDLVDGLLKFKYGKDHLCSACEWGKSKKASHPPKLVPSNHSKLELLHIDLLQTNTGSINQWKELDYNAKVCKIRTNNGTEFKNATLKAHYEKLGVMQQFLIAFSTAFFTQNWSIIHTRYNKIPYELLHGRKPNVEYVHVFGLLCYPTNDRDDLGKMKPKADIAMAYEHDSLEPVFQRFINDDSSTESMNIPSKEDLDNL